MSTRVNSPHRRARAAAVAVIGAAALGLGVATSVPASAAPDTPSLADIDGPFAGPGAAPDTQGKDQRTEKAEKLGGGLANEVIDLVTGVVKCGINIATDAVPCQL